VEAEARGVGPVDGLADGVGTETLGAPGTGAAEAEGVEPPPRGAEVAVVRFGVARCVGRVLGPEAAPPVAGGAVARVGSGAAVKGFTDGHVREEDPWNTNATHPPCGTLSELMPRLE